MSAYLLISSGECRTALRYFSLLPDGIKQYLVDTTLCDRAHYSGQRSNSDAPVASPFHTANAFLLSDHSIHCAHPQAFKLQGPTRLCSFPISLLYSPMKSRGSTIPRSLQPWRLLEAKDSTLSSRTQSRIPRRYTEFPDY